MNDSMEEIQVKRWWSEREDKSKSYGAHLVDAGHLVGCALIKRTETGKQIDGRSALGI